MDRNTVNNDSASRSADARHPKLKMTEKEIRNAKKNPYFKKMIADLLIATLGCFPAFFAVMLILAVVNTVTPVSDTLVKVLSFAALFGVLIGFLVKFFFDAGKRDLFIAVRSGYAYRDRVQALDEQIREEQAIRQAQQPTENPAFEELVSSRYGGDADAAMRDIIDCAKRGDDSLFGGKDGLKRLVESMTPAQREKYHLYAINAIFSDKAIRKDIVSTAADLTVMGLSDEQVRQAKVNPFRKRLILGGVLMLGALALLIVGLLIVKYLPQYNTFGKILASGCGIMGPIAAYDIADGLIKYFKFRKHKKKFAEEDRLKRAAKM